MNRKSRKRIQVLKPKLQRTRQQLAGAKRQTDQPGEIEELESQIAKMEAELKELENS